VCLPIPRTVPGAAVGHVTIAADHAFTQYFARRAKALLSAESTQIPCALGWSAVVMSLLFTSGLHLASRDFPATSFSPS
jgi:hypothetical protein